MIYSAIRSIVSLRSRGAYVFLRHTCTFPAQTRSQKRRLGISFVLRASTRSPGESNPFYTSTRENARFLILRDRFTHHVLRLRQVGVFPPGFEPRTHDYKSCPFTVYAYRNIMCGILSSTPLGFLYTSCLLVPPGSYRVRVAELWNAEDIINANI